MSAIRVKKVYNTDEDSINDALKEIEGEIKDIKFVHDITDYRGNKKYIAYIIYALI